MQFLVPAANKEAILVPKISEEENFAALNVRALLLWQKGDVLVVNKPPGMLSQPDKSGGPVLTDHLRKALQQKPEQFLAPVHRLDRNVSGALIFARSAREAGRLGEMIQAHKIQRCYLAIVKGDPGAEGSIDAAILKDERTNESRVSAKGKPAITRFQKVASFGSASLLKITLETGRSHQIRVHLAHIHHPLIGDRKYAKRPWDRIFSRPALHSYAVRLPESPDPIRAPLWNDLQLLLPKLGADPSLIAKEIRRLSL